MHSLAAPFTWEGVAGQASTNDASVIASFSSLPHNCAAKNLHMKPNSMPTTHVGQLHTTWLPQHWDPTAAPSFMESWYW